MGNISFQCLDINCEPTHGLGTDRSTNCATVSFLVSVTSKKSPNFYKSCTKLILIKKLKILTPLQKLPKNKGDLGKLFVAKGFEKLPKVQ